jgi:hypothetical protein
MRTAIVGRATRLTGRATRLLFTDPGTTLLSARMALWVVLVSVLARALPLPRAHGLTSTRVRRGAAVDQAAPARLARAIDRVLSLDLLVFRPSCWRRAMVLHRFLALNGIETRVAFGVQHKGDGLVHGHAWLEHQGQPLLENDAAAYVVTFTLPHAS